MSQFNDRDVELFIEKGTAALDDPEDKVAKSWENPDTGNSGTITAMRSFTRDGVQCREVLIENQSRSFYSRNTHDFCRKSDGTWRWIPPSTP